MSKKESAPNYWLFQANPQVFRLRDALRADALETFAVKQHRKKIQAGDLVILWQTGKEAGCYGLATVRGKAMERAPAETEKNYYQKEAESGLRVPISVEYNLWNKPITADLLPKSQAFKKFYAGLPGVNYKATAVQFERLLKTIEQMDVFLEPEPEYGLPRSYPATLNLILYGPPGTGKTYLSVNYALSIIENRPLAELALEKRSALRRRYEDYLGSGQIAFVTFHQSFSYEDFVEGIKPHSQNGQLSYRIENGVFKMICADARRSFIETLVQSQPPEKLQNLQPKAKEIQDVLDPEALLQLDLPPVTDELLANCRRYVLIIDEINRGNIANIFGELISLLEPDKREGRMEALSTILPYSKQTFSVPPNLYLIGAMNSADRSIAQMDAALRRRFAFKELQADPAMISRQGQPMAAGIDLVKLLEAINRRISLLLGKDYQIGHAYFLDVHTLDDVRQLFIQKILPLLQEYFFDDLGKLGLILGADFVEEVPIADEGFFADFSNTAFDSHARRQLYRLRPPEELDESAFIHIYDSNYRHEP